MSRVLSLAGGTLVVSGDDTVAPGDIQTFLQSRQWSLGGDGHWQNVQKERYNMSWEQAVACEFYEFITIGGVR